MNKSKLRYNVFEAVHVFHYLFMIFVEKQTTENHIFVSQAIGGVFAALANILSIALSGSNERDSAFVFFTIATVTSLAALIGYLSLYTNVSEMQLFTCTWINNNKIVNVGTCLYISTLENLRFKTCMGTRTCVITTRTRFCNINIS